MAAPVPRPEFAPRGRDFERSGVCAAAVEATNAGKTGTCAWHWSCALYLFARLRRLMTIDQARSAIAALTGATAADFPETNRRISITRSVVDPVRRQPNGHPHDFRGLAFCCLSCSPPPAYPPGGPRVSIRCGRCATNKSHLGPYN